MTSEPTSVVQQVPTPAAFPGIVSAAIVGGLFSAVAVALFSGDWIFASVGAGILGGILCAAFAVLVRRQAVGGGARIRLVVVAALIACAQVVTFRAALRATAFRGAFGVDATADVRSIVVERHFAGGPGDRITLIRFAAPAATLNRLASTFPPDESLATYRDGSQSWSEFWAATFELADADDEAWRIAPPMMTKPHLRILNRSTPGGPMEQLTLLWDDTTGEAYLMWSEG